MSLITGVIYPMLITGISDLIFRTKAEGSIIREGNKIIGSKLIGQKFISDKYFWSRPSSIDYNPFPSGASNLSPTSAKLLKLFNGRKEIFNKRNFVNDRDVIPNEMLFASASGVDPDISPQSAYMQVNRISEARKFSPIQKEKLINLIGGSIENPQIGFLGENRINVLLLNLELDRIK